jgi:predicted RNA binding protein YcfA (HicA-like mRNA interferase family)
MASEVRFAVVRKMLEANGWRLSRVRGSHFIFVKSGERPLPIPVHHGKVIPAYVRKAEKACETKE